MVSNGLNRRRRKKTKYKVVVTTGNKKNAGTKAKVGLCE